MRIEPESFMFDHIQCLAKAVIDLHNGNKRRAAKFSWEMFEAEQLNGEDFEAAKWLAAFSLIYCDLTQS